MREFFAIICEYPWVTFFVALFALAVIDQVFDFLARMFGRNQ